MGTILTSFMMGIGDIVFKKSTFQNYMEMQKWDPYLTL